jgi:hypothetical protein
MRTSYGLVVVIAERAALYVQPFSDIWFRTAWFRSHSLSNPSVVLFVWCVRATGE